MDYLSRPDTSNTIVIAPNAPPVCRSATSVEIALNIVLDHGDVYDTIKAFRVMGGAHIDEMLQDSMTFSFSFSPVGRFRVSYTTQRGSKVAIITIVPFSVPTLDSFCATLEPAKELVEIMASDRSGLLAITGPDAASNSKLVYSIINEVNKTKRRIIYVLERDLRYLIAHSDSMILQTEIGADTATFEEGLSSAYRFEPHLLYLGDLRPSDQIPSITHALGAGIMTVITSVSLPGPTLLADFCPPADTRASDERVCQSVTVIPGQDQLLSLKVNS